MPWEFPTYGIHISTVTVENRKCACCFGWQELTWSKKGVQLHGSGGPWGHGVSVSLVDYFEISSWTQSNFSLFLVDLFFVLPWVGPAQAHLVSTAQATKIKSNPKIYTRNVVKSKIEMHSSWKTGLSHSPWKYSYPLSQVIWDVLMLFPLRNMLFYQHTFLFLKEIWVNFLLVLCLVLSFIVATVYESYRFVLLHLSKYSGKEKNWLLSWISVME